jgi:hypothetical protein
MATVKETIKGMLLSPMDFYKSIKNESGFVKPWLYFAIITICIYLSSFILYIPLALSNPISTALSLFFVVILLPFTLALVFLTPFISAGIAHLGLMIFGVRTEYINTFKPISYSVIPGAAYSIILLIISFIFYTVFPVMDKVHMATVTKTGAIWVFLGFIIILIAVSLAQRIHVLVTEIIGIAYYHRISRWRAFFGLIIIPVIISLLMILVMFLLFLFFGFFLSASF